LAPKNYSKELKSKVALAAIKGNQTANEIASEFGIHVSLVNRWKKEAIEALPQVFGNNKAKQDKTTEIERDRLYQKVGKLQFELDWLKKTPDISNEYRREKTPNSAITPKAQYSKAM